MTFSPEFSQAVEAKQIAQQDAQELLSLLIKPFKKTTIGGKAQGKPNQQN